MVLMGAMVVLNLGGLFGSVWMQVTVLLVPPSAAEGTFALN